MHCATKLILIAMSSKSFWWPLKWTFELWNWTPGIPPWQEKVIWSFSKPLYAHSPGQQGKCLLCFCIFAGSFRRMVHFFAISMLEHQRMMYPMDIYFKLQRDMNPKMISVCYFNGIIPRAHFLCQLSPPTETDAFISRMIFIPTLPLCQQPAFPLQGG